jgi:lipopolysaccharide export LptBFGC system permease protein LptF
MSTFGDDSGSLSQRDDEEDNDADNTTTHEEGSSSKSSTLGANYREVRDMTKKENQNVETMRDLATGVLVIVACCISVSAFIFLSRNETDAFKLAVREIISRVHVIHLLS